MTGANDAQKEEEAFFDRYFPSGTTPQGGAYKVDIDDRPTKQQRFEDEGHKGSQSRGDRGKGRSDRGGGSQPRDPPGRGRARARRDGRSTSQWNEEETDAAGLREAITGLQRLVLRHEDSLSMIQSEYSFVAFLRVNAPSSIVGALYEAQRAWRHLRDTSPAQLTKPMRCSLLARLFMELAKRMRNLDTEEENRKRLEGLGWLSPDHSAWRALQWSVEKKMLIHDESRQPVSRTDAIALVDKVREMVAEPGLVMRFHPTRPLTNQMSGESLTCCLQLSIREPRAAVLHDDLDQLAGLACTQLIGMGLRRDRMGRSALAQSIAKSM